MNQKKKRIKANAMKPFRVESLRSVRRTPTRRAKMSNRNMDTSTRRADVPMRMRTKLRCAAGDGNIEESTKPGTRSNTPAARSRTPIVTMPAVRPPRPTNRLARTSSRAGGGEGAAGGFAGGGVGEATGGGAGEAAGAPVDCSSIAAKASDRLGRYLNPTAFQNQSFPGLESKTRKTIAGNANSKGAPLELGDGDKTEQ